MLNSLLIAHFLFENIIYSHESCNRYIDKLLYRYYFAINKTRH